MIICRTSGELGSIGSLGGKEPMVISVQPWDVSGGGAGCGCVCVCSWLPVLGVVVIT